MRSEGPLSSPLAGTAYVGGAKNSALKLMAASLLATGRTVITNVPDILDVHVMARLLEELGCQVTVDHPVPADTVEANPSGTVTIDVPEVLGFEAPYDLVRRLRASISVLGPLVTRCHRAKVALPGGDNIGSRGLDMHLTGLTELGAKIHIEHGFVVAEVPDRLRGSNLWLDFPSVGATENLLMAAVLAEGTTTIDNVAREPEIVDLCELLVEMGAEIEGASTSMLTVHGGRAGHLDIVLDKLASAGAGVQDIGGDVTDGFRVLVERRLDAFDVVTLPYPGFPTDLQPFAMTLAAVSDGTAMITENVFESRFMFTQELARLGADLRTDGHHAVVRGKPLLSGAPVVAHDIRAGAALVLAGLAAQGATTVAESHHIDRGYPYFAEMLRGLGADVERVDVPTVVT